MSNEPAPNKPFSARSTSFSMSRLVLQILSLKKMVALLGAFLLQLRAATFFICPVGYHIIQGVLPPPYCLVRIIRSPSIGCDVNSRHCWPVSWLSEFKCCASTLWYWPIAQFTIIYIFSTQQQFDIVRLWLFWRLPHNELLSSY